MTADTAHPAAEIAARVLSDLAACPPATDEQMAWAVGVVVLAEMDESDE